MNGSNNYPNFSYSMQNPSSQMQPGQMNQQMIPGQSMQQPVYSSGDPNRVARDFVLSLILRLIPGFDIPPRENFDTEELQGTFQQLLADNLGAYMIGEFLLGTNGMTTREGFLVGVGRSYILLFDFNTRVFTMCDAFSLKFASFPYLDATSLQHYIPRRYLGEFENFPGANLRTDTNGQLGSSGTGR